MRTREKLIDEYNRAVQMSGTLTVLRANVISHKIGLSATEFEAMDIIARHQPITAGHLAKYCGLTTGAITGLVDRLESAGFAQRSIDRADRRRVLISVVENEKMAKKVRELYRPIAEAFNEFVDTLNDDELEFLLEKQTVFNQKMEETITRMYQK